MPQMGTGAWAQLLLLALMWGCTFFFVELALIDLPAFTVVAARVVLGALTMLVVLALTGAALPGTAAQWMALVGMGVLNNAVPFSLLFWGQTEIASGLAAILNATTPIFSVVLAHWLTADERMTLSRLAAIALGVGGVALLVGPDALGDVAGGSLLAKLACLGAACSYALSAIYARRFLSGMPPVTLATGQLCSSAAIMACVALAVDGLPPMPGDATVAALLALGIPGTGLAYILYFRILAVAGATNLMLVTLLVPVTALLLGVFVLGEEITLHALGGMVLIGLGLAAIDGRPLRWLRGAVA